MSVYTPGPWEICGATHIWSPSEKANIASCSALRSIDHVGYAPPTYKNIQEAAANAAYIVCACNSHAELLTALTALERVCAEELSHLRIFPELDAARAAMRMATS